MLAKKEDINDYLKKYRSGEIKQGLGIGSPGADEYLRFKYGQFNMVNGLDNVGKTAWMLWYFLVLSVKYGIDWCIWSGENKSGQQVRDLIQMLANQPFLELSGAQVDKYRDEVLKYFTFVDNRGFYTNKDLYKMFEDSGRQGCLIDPYTGMNREYTHSANYDFLNETRNFVNSTGKTVYVNTHPNTEAARMFYTEKDGEMAGYPKPPTRSQSEGGQPFANRPDDIFTIHRLVGHPTFGYNTHIYVRKVKDTDTGGKVSPIDLPISFEYNRGLGFTCGGYNALRDSYVAPQPDFKPIEPNNEFSNTINF
jgi:hypothetical protein